MKKPLINNWIPYKSLQLYTKNFTMRNLSLEDANKKHISWLNDEETNAWLNSNWKKHDLNSVKKFILSQDNYKIFHLAVLENKNKTHIGNFTIIIDHYHKTAETRVLIGEKKWWGKGVVIECRSCIIEWLFNKIEVYKIYGLNSIKNVAAVFNNQKLGYSCEAVLKNHKLSKTNERYDVAVFSITKKKWESLNNK